MRAFATALVFAGLLAGACGGGEETASADRSRALPDPAPTASAQPDGPAAEPMTAQAPRRERKPLAGKTIVIDPGHNGHNYRNPRFINRPVDVHTKKKPCDTTGTATADGYPEAAFTWDVSVRLARLLRAQGARVALTRKNNTGVGPCLPERAAIANRLNADAALSVHADGSAPGNRGFHVILPKKIGGPVDPVVAESKRLGLAIRNAYRAGTGLPYSTYIGRNGLDQRDDLGGLNLSTVPKVFIECGNMRNPVEAAKFRDPAFRQRIARALAKGLRDYLT